MIRLVLHGALRRYLRDGGRAVEVAGAGRSLAEVLVTLGIPLTETAAFMVNGEQRDAGVRLNDGDLVDVVPAISGGSAEGAYGGVRVVDLTRALSGPYCTMMLGDHGADVVKVERPGAGDESRSWAPPHIGGISAYYLMVNRNKRGMTLDLKHPDGAAVLERLLAGADVLVENFSPGVLERLGFAPERLAAAYPRLIVCRISGFGQDGPESDRPAYDLIAQGMGGIMSLTGTAGGEPTMVGVPIGDLVAGMFAAFAVGAALHARARTGRGQVIDASMLGGQVALLSHHAGRYFADGTIPAPLGNVHASIVPYQTFATADGHVNICCANNAIYRRCCDALGLPELATDSRFVENADRIAHRDALIALMAAPVRRLSTAEVIRRLEAASVPVGPIQNLAELFASPVVEHLGLIAEVDHPTAGRVRAPGIPVRLTGTPAGVRRHPPLLGEHTDEILREVGYDEARIADLRRSGAL